MKAGTTSTKLQDFRFWLIKLLAGKELIMVNVKMPMVHFENIHGINRGLVTGCYFWMEK